jgi:O-acetyl-ADP-ribose deacetylase (regulator of RNase III)
MIYSSRKSILNSNAAIITNPVNCCKVMGKGLALEFKNKFPNHFVEYQKLCDSKELQIGVPKLVFDQRMICLFPTKIHWRDDSKIEYIDAGLKYIKNNFAITSIAFPKLGCGLGKLNWKDVKQLFVKYFSNVDYDVIIHE